MTSINYKEEGVIFNIQRFSVNDGPGIRTIVFLKGCPLSCVWCSNPESHSMKPDIMRDEDKCIGCGKCARVCKQGAISVENNWKIDRQKCIGCGECASICPTGALELKGERVTVQELIQVLKRDNIMYRKSGGGVTLSGGEPLVQWKFATELLKACKAQGWTTAIETTGYGSNDSIESVFPFIDYALLDCKHTNSEIHKKFTGVDTDIIRKNSRRISEITQVTLRIPTIPGVNAYEDEIRNISRFSKSLHNVDTIHILPYHTFGVNKYEELDREYLYDDAIKPLSKAEAEKLKKVVESEGLNCLIGG